MTHSSQDSVINRICRFKIYLNHAEELTIVPGTVWKWFRSWNNLKFWSHFQMSDIIRSFESNLDEKSSKSTRRFIQFQIKSVVSSWLNFSSSHSTQLNMVLEWGLEARKKIRWVNQSGVEHHFENSPELDRVRETIILHQLNLVEFLLIYLANYIFANSFWIPWRHQWYQLQLEIRPMEAEAWI